MNEALPIVTLFLTLFGLGFKFRDEGSSFFKTYHQESKQMISLKKAEFNERLRTTIESIIDVSIDSTANEDGNKTSDPIDIKEAIADELGQEKYIDKVKDLHKILVDGDRFKKVFHSSWSYKKSLAIN